ncbi:MAG: DegT/DnrJ/EryC1/StrS family aminotransferase, partial [Candidatus Solibacter sp.]
MTFVLGTPKSAPSGSSAESVGQDGTPVSRRTALAQAPELGGRFRHFTTFGRTALLGALRGARVAGGDVLLPAFTCNTTVTSAVLQAGGTPIFVEIDPRTLNMDCDELVRKASPRLRAVISHHYYGFACTNLGEINRFCERWGAIHIEDCSHSLGARSSGTLTGSWGRLAVFSFSKAEPNPGGGCISTDDRELDATIVGDTFMGSWLDQAVKNYHGFGHLYRLFVDTQQKHRFPDLLFRLSRSPLVLFQKLTRYDLRRARGTFYQSDHDSAVPIRTSLGMTSLQKRYI